MRIVPPDRWAISSTKPSSSFDPLSEVCVPKAPWAVANGAEPLAEWPEQVAIVRVSSSSAVTRRTLWPVLVPGAVVGAALATHESHSSSDARRIRGIRCSRRCITWRTGGSWVWRAAWDRHAFERNVPVVPWRGSPTSGCHARAGDAGGGVAHGGYRRGQHRGERRPLPPAVVGAGRRGCSSTGVGRRPVRAAGAVGRACNRCRRPGAQPVRHPRRRASHVPSHSRACHQE
jgi:hypothetical protein